MSTALPRSTDRTALAAAALALGGLAMVVLWIPFTLAHGPTSYNEQRIVAGMDMHGWGFLLGVVPNVLIASGLVAARGTVTEGRRGASRALWVVIGTLVASAALDLAWRSLGPPFSLFVLAPATVALAVLVRDRGRRTAWAVLATAYVVAVGLGLVPLGTSDSFGGYRIFGLAAHVAAGVGWLAVAGRMRAG